MMKLYLGHNFFYTQSSTSDDDYDDSDNTIQLFGRVMS